jgi:hypothetical protein
MKIRCMFAGFACLIGSAPALAQALPSGLYTINGTVAPVHGHFCPAQTNQAVTGTMAYPGEQNTENNLFIRLQAVTPGAAVNLLSLTAFPPVPATGLNGWSSSSPVAPNYSQYQNGRLIGDDVSAEVSFDLHGLSAGSFAAAQGTITMKEALYGPCHETFIVTLQRVATY